MIKIKDVKYTQEFRLGGIESIWHVLRIDARKVDGERQVCIQNRQGDLKWINWNIEVEVIN